MTKVEEFFKTKGREKSKALTVFCQEHKKPVRKNKKGVCNRCKVNAR